MNLSTNDLDLLRSKGIDSEDVKEQIEKLSADAPLPQQMRAVAVGNGILLFDDKKIDEYVAVWDAYLARAKREVTHFIPASGQSNRFFRDLIAFLEADYDAPQTNFEKNFFKHLPNFAFFIELNKCCLEKTGQDIEDLLEVGHYKTIVRLMLSPDGLDYLNLPTALFKFHTDQSHRLQKYLPKKLATYYSSFEDIRTPLQENLYESAMVSAVKGNILHICYSVQPQYRDLIRDYMRELKLPIEKKTGVSVSITLPQQTEDTCGVVLTENNELLRDSEGNLVLMPQGHGALLPVLNSLKGNVIFIKNIDNATPDPLKKLSVRYKKLLAGIMVYTQKKINRYMRLLEKDDITDDKLIEIIHFVENHLNVKHPNILRLERNEQVAYLISKLNRPLRVCGVVSNEDEQGGIPCWVANADGTQSLQFVEYHQISQNPDLVKVFNSSTHFNPVDMVCYVNDYKGKRFDFTQFVDNQSYMILHKNWNGVAIKQLEKPGLWNGSMADWNTILVEVPVKTFNPVKTINDLLRHEHQNT
jgi:hypothetical protein